MRILVYGLQSSGASLFTYFLGQLQNSFALIDVSARRKAPVASFFQNYEQKNTKIITKCTITAIPYQNIVDLYKPDLRILFIKNPFQNFMSLKQKRYRRTGGTLFNKIRLLESYFNQSEQLFDCVIKYEDFLNNRELVISQLNKIGLDVNKEMYNFNKDVMEVSSEGLKNKWKLNRIDVRVGYGNIHLDSLNKPILNYNKVYEVDSHSARIVKRYCPQLVKYYSQD